uniref:Ig-like domain-containing protein n=1 Tax=Nothobranchius furzeri TaxID=105023 RepID=A0A8C6M5S8_NOTFU
VSVSKYIYLYSTYHRHGITNFHFIRGTNMYSYDGDDFLAFDDKNEVWIAAVGPAVETGRKWNSIPVLTEYTKGYLENECMAWMIKYWSYGREQLQQRFTYFLFPAPPEVHLFSQRSHVDTKVFLTCLSTGFYPEDVTLQIKRNGRILTAEDGLETSGIRPNEDDTFQRRDRVEILETDVSTYTCEVIQPASNVHVERTWGNKNFFRHLSLTASFCIKLFFQPVSLLFVLKNCEIGHALSCG